MRIADAHCDTLYSIAIEKHAPEACAVTPERLKTGGVCLQTFALFAGRKGTFGTPYQDGLDMIRAADRLSVPMLRADLPEAFPDEPAGIFSCEGGEMLEGSLERLYEFDRMVRLRMITLTWNFENEIGDPGKCGSDRPLKPFGRKLLREMDALGILSDVSHLNDAGFWDVCERAALPPIASHSNARWLCGHSRNLTRDMVRAVIERRGFIGINFYSNFLASDRPATLSDVLAHIDAICEMGGEDVLGFGSDFDGIESWPEGLGHPGDFPNLIDLLRRHGYTEVQLEKMTHNNLWRVLQEAQRARMNHRTVLD